MINSSDNWDIDIQWLRDNGYRLTEAQESAFSERVAIMIVDAGLSENDARKLAIEGINERSS